MTHAAGRCLLGALLLLGCLPVETRPEPGALRVAVRGNEALADGIPLTADGWSIGYDRFVITIGHSWLAGDECDVYSDADYSRIVDAQRSEPQKLSLLYGDGRCGLAFALTAPNEDSLVTAGVSEAEKAFMLTSVGNGIPMRAAGRAIAGDRQKSFSWYFRRYTGYYCGLEGEVDRRFVLNEQRDASATIVLRGEALFELDREREPGVLRFEPFAAADDVFGDGDGEITEEELERTPSTEPAFATLQGQLSGSLFPAVPELDRGPCDTVPLNDTSPDHD